MTTGTVDCWGASVPQNPGDNQYPTSLYPTPIPGVGGVGVLTNVVSLAADLNNLCVVVATGEVDCWNGPNAPVPVPGVNGLGFLHSAVSVVGFSDSQATFCALLTDGTVVCWGQNSDGALGTSYVSGSSWTPVNVQGLGGAGLLSDVTQIAAAGSVACALRGDGTVVCWGAKWSGQSDVIAPTPVVSPDASTNLSEVSSIVATGAGGCALLADHSVDCWGRDDNGELGNGSLGTPAQDAVAVVGVNNSGHLTNIMAISGAGGDVCAASTSQEVFCWGFALNGRIGSGIYYSNYAVDTPTPVAGVGGAGLLGDVASSSPLATTSGVGQVTLTWQAPPASDSSAISSYSVTPDPACASCSGLMSNGATSTTITGLTAGTAYTFSVHATNASGPGPDSVPSNAVTPLASWAPTAPLALNVARQSGRVVASWTSPASTGGSSVLSYTAYAFSPYLPTAESSVTKGSCTVNAPSNAAAPVTCVIQHLTNGVAYSVRVVALNANGASVPANYSYVVTPASVPQSPSRVFASPARTSATVLWTPPASGGSPILSYQVTSIPGAHRCVTGSHSCQVPGLSLGASYRFDVVAVNAVGASAPTISNSVVTTTWGSASDLPQAAQLLGGRSNSNGPPQILQMKCTSGGNCVAVGVYVDAQSVDRAFGAVEVNSHWQRAVQIPGTASLGAAKSSTDGGAEATSVSCPSSGACTVGGYYIDKFGTRFAFVATENAGTWRPAVALQGSVDLSVASSNLGVPPGVTSLSCSTATECVAIGTFDDSSGRVEGFLARQTKGTWRDAVPIPGLEKLNGQSNVGTNGALPTAVTCATPSSCVIVGSFTDPQQVTQAFDDVESNGLWSNATVLPGSKELNIGANSSNDGAQLNDVSCGAPGDCTAVGSYTNSVSEVETMSATMVHGAWQAAAILPGTLALATGGSLVDFGATAEHVSCTAPGDCTVGGSYVDNQLNQHPFVGTEVRGVWRNVAIVPAMTFLNTDGNADVVSLSCSSPGNCTAGGYFSANGASVPYLADERGGVWLQAQIIQGLSYDVTSGDGATTALSCASDGACAAATTSLSAPNNYVVQVEDAPVAPSAPQRPVLVPANGAVTLSWQKPLRTGTVPITSYKVVANPGAASCTTTTLRCTVAHLSPATAYDFSIMAVTSRGAGESASTAAVYPASSSTLGVHVASNVASLGARLVVVLSAPRHSGLVTLLVDASRRTSCSLDAYGQCAVHLTPSRRGVEELSASLGGSHSAPLAIFVPQLSLPSSGVVNEQLSEVVTFCPPKATIVVTLGDGRVLRGVASGAGVATMSFSLYSPGRLSVTTSVNSTALTPSLGVAVT